MQNLLTFLNGNENILSCPYDNTYSNYKSETHYIKVDSEFPSITYLYYRNFQDGITNPFNELKFAGIYSRDSNLLVCDSYLSHQFEREQLDLNGLILKEVSDTLKETIRTLREKVQELVPFDSENLSFGVELSSYREKEAKEEAYNHYIYGTVTDKDHYGKLYSAQLEHEQYPIFVQYLLGNEQAIQEEAERFIKEEEKGLAERLKYTKTVIAELENLNLTNQYIERKKMFNSVEESMKTIQIKVEKDEKEFDFKIENSFTTRSNYISTYQIVQASDRAKYESIFGRHADIQLDDIVEIRYGRKTLYQRESIVA